jgi:ribosome-associated translation inhibitor RaiA
MNILVNYKHVNLRKPVEVEVGRHIGKLERLLKNYSPDLVQLHGAFDKSPRTADYLFSLRLWLPTGTLNVTGEGTTVRLSVKHAFGEIEDLVKRHQSKIRREHEWKRKRPRAAIA